MLVSVSAFGQIKIKIIDLPSATDLSGAFVPITQSGITKKAASTLFGDWNDASTNTNSGLKTFLDGTLGMRNVANTFTSKFTNTNSAARTYTLPDFTGNVLVGGGTNTFTGSTVIASNDFAIGDITSNVYLAIFSSSVLGLGNATSGILQFDNSSAVYTDNLPLPKGIVYAGANYVTNPRSLTDKGYVDTKFGQGSNSISNVTSFSGTAQIDFTNVNNIGTSMSIAPIYTSITGSDPVTFQLAPTITTTNPTSNFGASRISGSVNYSNSSRFSYGLQILTTGNFGSNNNNSHYGLYVSPGNGTNTGSGNNRYAAYFNGFVGIGTLTPTSALHVVGSPTFVDGNQGAGKVLTSDASGVASWAAPSGGSSGRATITSQTIATDANITAAAGVSYFASANLFTAARTIDVSALNTDNDYIEIYLDTQTFNLSFTGASVYLSDNTTTVSNLPVRVHINIRRKNGRLYITN